MFIRFVTTGGTIDKVYFDEMSRFEVGESVVKQILADGLVSFDYDVVAMFRKDSLELTDDDRQTLRDYIIGDDAQRYVISHGTDTMVKTADVLAAIPDRVIVLTGALSPARFRTTDAVFNVGMAVATVQSARAGVYIVMNGRVFESGQVRKDGDANRFVDDPG